MNKRKPVAGLVAAGAFVAGVEFELAGFQTSDAQPRIIPESRGQIVYGRTDHGPEESSYAIHTIEGVQRLATTFGGPM